MDKLTDQEILDKIEELRAELERRGSLSIGLCFQSERMKIALDKATEELNTLSFTELLQLSEG